MTLPATPSPDAPREPLITVTTITTTAAALLAGFVAFGLKITADQQAALLTLIGVVAPIIVGIWGRARVFSPATVRDMVVNANRRQ